jgi:outer membrane protein assembly factor BamA
MNSVYDKTKPGKFRYYRIRYDLGDITLQLRHRFSDKVMLFAGPTFQFYSYDSVDKFNKIRNVELNSLSGLNQSNFSKRQSYFGANFSLNIDTRNSTALPEKGINWNTTFKYLTGVNKNSYDNVSQLNSDFSFYLKLVPGWLTFANKTGGGITMGDDFEFFQAQFLGSGDNLRGYRKERFAGKSKFYNQAEIRLKIANLRTYLFPASLGVFAFLDAGRVWVKNDTSNKMLHGYGGGLWFSPLKRIVITVSYAISKEDKMPLVGLGWRF